MTSRLDEGVETDPGLELPSVGKVFSRFPTLPTARACERGSRHDPRAVRIFLDLVIDRLPGRPEKRGTISGLPALQKPALPTAARKLRRPRRAKGSPPLSVCRTEPGGQPNARQPPARSIGERNFAANTCHFYRYRHYRSRYIDIALTSAETARNCTAAALRDMLHFSYFPYLLFVFLYIYIFSLLFFILSRSGLLLYWRISSPS